MLAAIGYFKAASVDANDAFGTSVAVSGDGATVVVGVPGEDSNATGIDGNAANNSAAGSGAAYVFARTAGDWSQQAYLKASNTALNDAFGKTVAISSDGSTIAIGAPQQEYQRRRGVRVRAQRRELGAAGSSTDCEQHAR